MAGDRSIMCSDCPQEFSTEDDYHQHVTHFQFRAQQILLRYQNLQQEMMSELSQCLAHKHFGKKSNDGEDDQSEGISGSPDETDEEVRGIRGEGKIDLLCPECQKSFKGWKGLVRHYQIHVNCYEICCDRIFKRVSLYTNHKCDVPKAIIRREDLKRESEKQLRQSLTPPELRPHASKRRKIRRESVQRPQTIQVSPVPSPRAPLHVGSSPHLGCDLALNEVSFDFNTDASLNMHTLPSFTAQPMTEFSTYGSGARAPLMFKGTISGPHHDDMLFTPESFLSGGIERNLQVNSAVQGGPEWLAGQESFQAINPGTQN